MSNEPWPEQYAELCRLIQLLYDETITPEQCDDLRRWLSRDKQARRIYAQYMNLYASLHWEKSQELQFTQTLPRRTSKTIQSPILGFLSDTFEAGARFLSRGLIVSLALTIGLPVVLLIVLLSNAAREPVPPALPTPPAVAPIAKTPAAEPPEANSPVMPVAVAKVTRMRECVWSEDHAPLLVGSGLFSRQQVSLTTGLLEITFADGATVLLEGPVKFDANDGNAGFLHFGRLVAKVSEQAAGFAVRTPSATVVDLGTEFGVAVEDAKGTAEVEVFQGEVELQAKPREGGDSISLRTLATGRAVRVEISDTADAGVRIEDILKPRRAFRRDMPEEGPPIELIAHWDFEGGPRTPIIADRSGNGFTGTLRNGVRVDAHSAVGKQAALFDGKDDIIDIAGLRESGLFPKNNYTFVAWIKPRSFGGKLYGRVFDCKAGGWVILLDGHRKQSDVTNNYVDSEPTDGSESVVRTPAGSIRLDGRWRHITFTAGKADPSGLVTLRAYLDGVLVAEGSSRRQVLTKSIASIHLGNSEDLTRAFDGWIDEVAIFNRALNEEEVGRLIDRHGGDVGEYMNAK